MVEQTRDRKLPIKMNVMAVIIAESKQEYDKCHLSLGVVHSVIVSLNGFGTSLLRHVMIKTIKVRHWIVYLLHNILNMCFIMYGRFSMS